MAESESSVPETENSRARERVAILGQLIATDPEDENGRCFFCKHGIDDHFENCLWLRAVQVGAVDA